VPFYLIVVLSALAIGHFSLPTILPVPGKQNDQLHYDHQGAMLKIVADLRVRHIRLEEGQSRIYNIDHQPVLIYRQKIQTKPGESLKGIYLIEGIKLSEKDSKEHQQVQFGVVDTTPAEDHANLQLGFWRIRPKKKLERE
jgi:hypothetical protein